MYRTQCAYHNRCRLPFSPVSRLPMSQLTRRTFIRTVAVGGTFLGLPAVTYRAALLAEDKPSETIRIGAVGVGNQGKPDMNAVKKNVVAVCDVDKDRVA